MKETYKISPAGVKEVTLLSCEEYLKAKDLIRPVDMEWWLRDRTGNCMQDHTNIIPNDTSAPAVCTAIPNGLVYHEKVDFLVASVRPALRLFPGHGTFVPGERFGFGGMQWTTVGDGLALCDETVGKHAFRTDIYSKNRFGSIYVPNANRYEISDIRVWLEDWAEDRLGIKGPVKITADDIMEVTLLSKEEYDAAADIIPVPELYCGHIGYWLRSQGSSKDSAIGINKRGRVQDVHTTCRAGVRPALRLSPQGLKPGDKVRFSRYTWTVIAPGMALCDINVYDDYFDRDGQNGYFGSHIWMKLYAWASDDLGLGISPDR